MELSIQERLKDLRVERGLTLEQPHSGQYFCRLLPGAKGFPHRSQSRVRCR